MKGLGLDPTPLDLLENTIPINREIRLAIGESML
jgi:hypothetical protein